jgi:ABC-2 type transport system ATP-binding protein
LLLNSDYESVKKELGSIEGVEEVQMETNNEGVLQASVTCRSSADLRGDIYRKIKETEWILIELYQETQTLENIFRELTTEN